MWSMAVVMINEHGEDSLEMPHVHDQQPIQTFRANRPYKSFRDPVCLRRLNRCPNDANAGTLKHVVNARCEFAIMVANQYSHRVRAVGERPCDLPRLLRDPVRVRM